jgi:hypothetical protein
VLGSVGQALVDTIVAALSSRSPVTCVVLRRAIEKACGAKKWFSEQRDAADTLAHLVSALITEDEQFGGIFGIEVNGSILMRETCRFCVRLRVSEVGLLGSDLCEIVHGVTKWPEVLTVVCESPNPDQVPSDIFEIPKVLYASGIDGGVVHYALRSYVRRHVEAVGEDLVRHYTARTSVNWGAEADDGWGWSFFDDDKPVREVWTPPGRSVRDAFRLAFFVRIEDPATGQRSVCDGEAGT